MSIYNSYWVSKRHQFYNMTHPTQDSGELTRRLFEAREDILSDYMESKHFQALEDRLVDKTLQRTSVEVVDKASPVIKKLNDELNNLLK